MSWGVSAAVHAALETALPAETEAVTYPPSVIEEAPSASSASSIPPEPLDVFLPRRRPAVPPPAVPRDDSSLNDTPLNDPGATLSDPVVPGPFGPVRQVQAPDLAVLDQVLRGLQRMA
jgi:hypothetical protein